MASPTPAMISFTSLEEGTAMKAAIQDWSPSTDRRVSCRTSRNSERADISTPVLVITTGGETLYFWLPEAESLTIVSQKKDTPNEFISIALMFEEESIIIK